MCISCGCWVHTGLWRAFPFLLSPFLTHAFQWEGHNLQICGKFKLDSNRPGLGWEALFKTAETGKQPRCPSQDEWVKLWDIYTMDNYSASMLWISKFTAGLGQQLGRGRDSDNCLPRSSLPKFNDQEGFPTDLPVDAPFHLLTPKERTVTRQPGGALLGDYRRVGERLSFTFPNGERIS